DCLGLINDPLAFRKSKTIAGVYAALSKSRSSGGKHDNKSRRYREGLLSCCQHKPRHDVGPGLPSYSLSSAMVLTAILTAISDRSGVFAGVRCRRIPLQVRIFEHWRTAADAVPVTYKQGVTGSSPVAPTTRHRVKRGVRRTAVPARRRRATPSFDLRWAAG
ncbi:MAG: hypothetical protein K0R13_2565, partial [Propionibacteriaceae bacterium]|nr:hypothetical protein [Propionibacteriaceae bacterium]